MCSSDLDAAKRSYDKSAWSFAKESDGRIKKDPTLKDPRCVFQILRHHYDRYTLEALSGVTDTPVADLQRIYQAYASTGRPEKSGTMLAVFIDAFKGHPVGIDAQGHGWVVGDIALFLRAELQSQSQGWLPECNKRNRQAQQSPDSGTERRAAALRSPDPQGHFSKACGIFSQAIS